MPKFETTVTVPLWAFDEPGLRKIIATIKDVVRELHLDEPDTIPHPDSVKCLRVCIEELQMRCPVGNKRPFNGYFRNGTWVQPYRQY